jgi:hypothetical protein
MDTVKPDMIQISKAIGIVGVGVYMNTTNPTPNAMEKNIANGNHNRMMTGSRKTIIGLWCACEQEEIYWD